MPLQDDYRPDPAVPEMITYPVVADDEAYEINRFQFTNTSLPGTTLTLGRQRILLDDQRFVGNSGWRQNEQTFDAFRMVNRSVTNLVLDATYLNRVNRVNGPDSPQGVYKGDGFLLNAGYQTKIGKISAFGYLLDFEPITNIPAGINPVRDSTSTYGLRFAGDKPVGKIKLAYAASYADADRLRGQPARFRSRLRVRRAHRDVPPVRPRRRHGDHGRQRLPGRGKGFTTPLGTLHKFQGWADKFLTTPAERPRRPVRERQRQPQGRGRARYARLHRELSRLRRRARSRPTTAASGTLLAAKHKRFNLMLKYADYQQGELAVGAHHQQAVGADRIHLVTDPAP